MMAGQKEVNFLEALLKASEAAALMGVSARWVQVMAKKGGYSNVRVQANSRGRDIYLIPLSSLPDAAQQKYFAEHAPAALTAVAPAKAKKADRPAACKPLEAYTAEERGEIGYWITTVDRWQTYRNKAGTKKAECDEKICAAVPDGRARPSNQRGDALQEVGGHPRG